MIDMWTKEQDKIAKKHWYETHKDYNKKYYHKNKEKIKERIKLYQQTHIEQKREFSRRAQSKRRHLPIEVILNEPFKGSHLHHLTTNIGVYIPQELHWSIYHNLENNIGMKEINDKALDFAEKVYNLSQSYLKE